MATPLGPHWTTATDVLDDDPDGEQVELSAAAWGRAVMTAAGTAESGITCAPDVFGPILVGGPREFVVCRSRVRVTAPGARDLLAACWSAWERWWGVDEAGNEHPDAEVDPFDQPVRDGDGYVLGYDVREVEDPEPLRAARCLEILFEELRRRGCTPAEVSDAS